MLLLHKMCTVHFYKLLHVCSCDQSWECSLHLWCPAVVRYSIRELLKVIYRHSEQADSPANIKNIKCQLYILFLRNELSATAYGHQVLWIWICVFYMRWNLKHYIYRNNPCYTHQIPKHYSKINVTFNMFQFFYGVKYASMLEDTIFKSYFNIMYTKQHSTL